MFRWSMVRSRVKLVPGALGGALLIAVLGCGESAEVGDPQGRGPNSRGGGAGRGLLPGSGTGGAGGSDVTGSGGSKGDATTVGGASSGGGFVLREASFSRPNGPESTAKWRLRESSLSRPERVCSAKYCLVGEIR